MIDDEFFEIAESDAYKSKFSNPISFVVESGHKYYHEENLRQLLEENGRNLARAKHPRGIRDYKHNAIRLKQMIKQAMWIVDEVNRKKLREPSQKHLSDF